MTTRAHELDAGRPLALPAAAAGRRFWEIDLARTVAIAMMVAYHIVYDIDLVSSGATGPDPFRGGWGLLPEATGSLFLLVAGLSVAVAEERMRVQGRSSRDRLRRHGRHAAVVLGAGFLVIFATWLVFPDDYVRFGILQAIGVGILVSALTVRLGLWNLLLGGAVIASGLAVAEARTGVPGGLVLGFEPPGFSSVDHWPLLPWLGPMLIGVALGLLLYRGGRRAGPMAWAGRAEGRVGLLATPGRHSLPVYLAHQLVLIPVVWVALQIADTAGG